MKLTALYILGNYVTWAAIISPVNRYRNAFLATPPPVRARVFRPPLLLVVNVPECRLGLVVSVSHVRISTLSKLFDLTFF